MKYKEILTRREMLTRCSTGFGMLALQGRLSNSAFAVAGEGVGDGSLSESEIKE